jgi:hypothetical protein
LSELKPLKLRTMMKPVDPTFWSSKIRLASLLLAISTCGGCETLADPEFQPHRGNAADVGPVLNNYSQFTVPKNGLIVVEGDGLAYGSSARGKEPGINGSSAPRSPTPFPETLSHLLGVRVENRGYPGDTIAKGEEHWRGQPVGNLLIISYGYEDAKAGTSKADYEAVLNLMISQASSQGAGVILLLAPIYADKTLSEHAEASRNAMREAKAHFRTQSFDVWQTQWIFSHRYTDGSYQSDSLYKALAYTIAPYIAVAPPVDGHPKTALNTKN